MFLCEQPTDGGDLPGNARRRDGPFSKRAARSSEEEAGQQPRNLRHFVVDNRVCQTVGGTPMVNHRKTDYAAIARGAGLDNIWSLASVREVEQALPDILATDGPTFAVLNVEAEPNYGAKYAGSYEGPEMKYRFGRTLERKLGITVFGPQGY